MTQRAGFGELMSETASIIGDTSRAALVYVLVVGGMSALGMVLGLVPPEASYGIAMGFSIDETDTAGSALFDFAAVVVGIVAGYLLIKRLLAARGRLRGDENRFWPYLGMAILSAIAIVFGLILLIVPGLFLLVRWSAASGYAVGAQHGVVQSLSSSWHATKGHGWSIFFAGLVLFLGIVIAAGIVGGIFGAVDDMVGAVAGAFVDAAAGAVMTAFGIAVYCRVQPAGEGLQEVFA